jgi:hypothetical protein
MPSAKSEELRKETEVADVPNFDHHFISAAIEIALDSLYIFQ